MEKEDAQIHIFFTSIQIPRHWHFGTDQGTDQLNLFRFQNVFIIRTSSYSRKHHVKQVFLSTLWLTIKTINGETITENGTYPPSYTKDQKGVLFTSTSSYKVPSVNTSSTKNIPENKTFKLFQNRHEITRIIQQYVKHRQHLSSILLLNQRVLNDVQRTRLSCGRMIRLLAHPPPHHLLLACCISFAVFLCIAGQAY